jgi:hypothetical protein
MIDLHPGWISKDAIEVVDKKLRSLYWAQSALSPLPQAIRNILNEFVVYYGGGKEGPVPFYDWTKEPPSSCSQ